MSEFMKELTEAELEVVTGGKAKKPAKKHAHHHTTHHTHHTHPTHPAHTGHKDVDHKSGKHH